MIYLTCITVKFQKCGKKNCKCVNGHLHGPYYWLINYKKNSGSKKGKYNWVYLGKDGKTVERNIKSQSFTKKWKKIEWDLFNSKINSLEEKRDPKKNNYKLELDHNE